LGGIGELNVCNQQNNVELSVTTRLNLAGWLTRLALEANAAEKRALLMQCLSPIVRTLNDQAERGADGLADLDSNQWKIEGATIKVVIKDRSLVMPAWRNAYSGRLRVEPCRKRNDDGLLADGIMALFGDRPLLSLVAIDAHLMELQIGGFDKSVIVHPGNLMNLSRQVIDEGARDRNGGRDDGC
jgi:hypothetical protein